MGTFIVGTLVLLAAVLSARRIYMNYKAGKGLGCEGCSGCNGSCSGDRKV